MQLANVRVIATFLVLLYVSGELTGQIVASKGAESGAILQKADQDFCRDTRARGLDGWLAHFAPDAVIAQKNPPVFGADALREHYKKLFALTSLDFQWAPVKAVLFSSGDLGYTEGRYTLKFVSDGKPVSEAGSYLTVWKKQKDGSWKVLSDFGAADK